MKCSTSEQILASIQNYIDTGKMVNNIYYFIYEEKNYTKLNINGEKMKSLYSLQNQTYWKSNHLSNYILLVNNITGDGKEMVKDLALSIINDYNPGSNNYCVILLSIITQKSYGYANNNRLSDSDIKAILDNMGDYLKRDYYFQALEKAINDLDYYYNKVYNNNPTDKSKDESTSLIWLWILLGVAGLIILIIIIVCIVKNCCGTRNSGYMKGINNNYSYNRSINDDDYYCDNTHSNNIHIISHHHSDIDVNINSNDHSHWHHNDNDGEYGHAVESGDSGHGHAVESGDSGHGHAVESSWGDSGHGHAVESGWGDGGGHAVESGWGGNDSGGYDSGGYDGGYDGGGDCGGDCGGDGGGD
jgi:uncharacterized membrane protein YgcG